MGDPIINLQFGDGWYPLWKWWFWRQWILPTLRNILFGKTNRTNIPFGGSTALTSVVLAAHSASPSVVLSGTVGRIFRRVPHWRGVNNSHDWGWLLKFASITNGDNLGMVSWVYHISRELKPNSNGLKTNISSNSFANQMGCMLIRLCLAMTFDFGTPTTSQTFLSQTIQNRSKSIWNPNLAIMPHHGETIIPGRAKVV